MNQTNQTNYRYGYGYSLQGDAGSYLRSVRQECEGILQRLPPQLQPKTAEEHKVNITGCVLTQFTELDKAMFASRQYILTLWPAFVGAIVALAPNPSSMVYDNIFWSALFALTSGGLPGMEKSYPPHHAEANSESAGRAMCENWHFDPLMPKAMAKEDSMGSSSRGIGYIFLEWALFLACLALWLYFCVYFGSTVQPALDFTSERFHLPATVWYYISAGPALVGIIFELIRDRIDLYEPDNSHRAGMEEISEKGAVEQAVSLIKQQRFYHVEVTSVHDLWLRIIRHQCRGSRYRILVRDHYSHQTQWLWDLGRAIVTGSRVAIFTIGSITMGNIVLMPVPDDLYLFILILFTTGLPRLLWPTFWTNGSRGADLVVWVSTARTLRPASGD